MGASSSRTTLFCCLGLFICRIPTLIIRKVRLFGYNSCSGPVTVTYESTAAEGSAEYLDDLASAINYADLHHCYGDGADTFLLLK
ncbi:hypothetical protein [Chryseobacterium indoltheticum]|uniref:hypothetical protein n=1 Tax=Chryseobacterium indoltheticum TaxID=254 RepID=UPI0011C05F32|nr:hypothetical protein [Chryseobacterium indoltheticum]